MEVQAVEGSYAIKFLVLRRGLLGSLVRCPEHHPPLHSPTGSGPGLGDILNRASRDDVAAEFEEAL